MNGNANGANATAFLVFVVFVSGCQIHREARIAAATAAIEHSLKLQAVLAETHECPLQLAGWSHEDYDGPNVLSTMAGTADRQYKLSWRCEQDRHEFSVTVHYSFDDHVFVVGEFGGPLKITYGHFTDYRESVLPEQPDVSYFAELLAYGG